MCFSGKPDPPQKLSVTSCTDSSVGLQWEHPEFDGGSRITGYIVEMRPTNRKTWTRVDNTQSLELTVGQLSEDSEYAFRVAAQNAVGVGEFVQLQQSTSTKSTTDEIGEHSR